MYLAWKEIKYAKLRYALIVGVMVLVAYVVFMLTGLADGLADGNKQAILDWKSSAIVLSDDSNKISSASVLKRSDLDRVSVGEGEKNGRWRVRNGGSPRRKKREAKRLNFWGAPKEFCGA